MRTAAALLLVCAVAGCRATPAAPLDDMGLDLSTGGGGGDDLETGDGLTASVDLAMCPVGPEICGNGCDDDRNGYSDDDDPACTSQMLVTFSMGANGTPALWRFILEPTPHVVVLDGNPVGAGAMATFNRAFSPAAYVAFDATKQLRLLALDGGVYDNLSPGFSTRDVCVFNGELIVVDPAHKLHRFMMDAKTEILPPVTVIDVPSSCSSDGEFLYVAGHTAPLASEIAVYGKSANGPVSINIIPIPDALINDGYDRLVDFAYLKKGGIFLGLFAMSGGKPDNMLQGQVMAPFWLDGGSGPYIDGGVWHGVGEFLP